VYDNSPKENTMGNSGFPLIAWLIFLASAALEVGGDAVIRKGLRGCGWIYIATGCSMLAAYGIVVNMVKWDFSKLLGVYVAVFAAVSVLAGRFLFQENIAPTTWVGVGIIIVGGLVIQIGQR
jgi:drug/metabolite transporter (DMT)-like permease